MLPISARHRLFASGDSFSTGDPCLDLIIVVGVLIAVGRAVLRSSHRMKAWEAVIDTRVQFFMLSSGILAGLWALLGRENDLLESVGVGVLAAFIVGVLAAFMLPIILFLFLHVVWPPFVWFGRVVRYMWRVRQARKTSRVSRRPPITREQPPDPNLARSERERVESQRRRADARASCELFYSQHAPEIGNRFGKEAFNDFVARHLGDDQTPEHVEQRAQQLLALLKSHLAKVAPPIDGLTLDQILATFDDRMRRVRDSSLDERDKETVLIQLAEEREEAIKRAVREGRL